MKPRYDSFEALCTLLVVTTCGFTREDIPTKARTAIQAQCRTNKSASECCVNMTFNLQVVESNSMSFGTGLQCLWLLPRAIQLYGMRACKMASCRKAIDLNLFFDGTGPDTCNATIAPWLHACLNFVSHLNL